MKSIQPTLTRTFVAAIITAAALSGFALPIKAETAVTQKNHRPVFKDLPAQTKEFIGYADSISLAPEQQKVKEAVLSTIPAPCCKKFSTATCCCPCNMAKSIWGLSNFMLARHNASAEELRTAVDGWIRVINPSGFTGDACDNGGCKRPFAKNGCAGMDQEHLIF